MDNNLISKLSLLVEEACNAQTNTFGYGIWSHHIKPMLSIARKLALQLGADEEIVTIAVLLHDYAGIRDESKHQDHHIYGADEAERILVEYAYPRQKIDLVKECIISHRSSVSISRDTKEQQCVADADAIVHIEQFPSLFFLAYHNLGMGIDEGLNSVRKKLERDWRKLSRNGKQAIRKKYEMLQALLE